VKRDIVTLVCVAKESRFFGRHPAPDVKEKKRKRVAVCTLGLWLGPSSQKNNDLELLTLLEFSGKTVR